MDLSGTLDGLFNSSSDDSTDDSAGGSLAGTLSQLVQSSVTQVAQAATTAASSAAANAINPTRSTNTAPAPDLVAKAATPGAAFTSAKVAGVSLPLILAAVAAFLYFGHGKH